MIADVLGYSRLTEVDERLIIEKILKYNESLIFPNIEEYNGKLIKNTGDGFLATFYSGLRKLVVAFFIITNLF